MAEQPRTRQELYEQIRETSKGEFILAEMIRLGFWKEDSDKPSIPKEILEKKGAIHRELRALIKEDRKLDNPEQWLKDYRQQRLKESREKQAKNRQRRAEEKAAKTKAWKERNAKEILYLGEDISNKLHHKESNEEQLKQFGLPDFKDAGDLAKAMKLDLSKLKFLAFNRKVSTVSHYKRFYMQKKSGGQRLISAPMPLLKSAQYWVLENIIDKVPVAKPAHGFRLNHSILTNATPHIGQDVVVNMDFKDFFPTITFGRVKGVFVNLGYSEKLASIFAALCTEPDVDEVEMDGETFFVAKGPRHLPQGAPTSPALTNVLCYKLDQRLTGACKKLGFVYTRYADDLTFSTKGESAENLKKLRWQVRKITQDEGFVLHPDKERIMRKGSKQEVTGLVVNEGLGVDRKTLKKFRALLHQIKSTGTEGKQWGNGKNLAASVWGYAHFVAMVKPEKGKKLLAEIETILPNDGSLFSQAKNLKTRISEESKKLTDKNNSSDKDSDGEKPKWKLW